MLRTACETTAKTRLVEARITEAIKVLAKAAQGQALRGPALTLGVLLRHVNGRRVAGEDLCRRVVGVALEG